MSEYINFYQALEALKTEKPFNSKLEDFKRTLSNVLLSPKITFSTEDLCWQFGMNWNELKPLLDEYTEYTIVENQIKINNEKPVINSDELATLRKIFYGKSLLKKNPKYRQQVMHQIPQTLRDLIIRAVKGKVVISNGHMLSLEKKYRL